MSEFTFTSLVQRGMEEWLDVRMHYGHPDIHDRLWLTTRGGLSKGNKVLCINEDIFGSFETMLRGGRVTYKEYALAGKGKDLGFAEVAAFEAKIACGNAEQALSRDMMRVNESMGIFRVLGFFHTANGFFINNVLVVWTTLWFVYSSILLTLFVPEASPWAMVTLEKDMIFMIQLGILQTIPLLAEMLVEKGVSGMMITLFRLFVLGGPIFYLFHVCTRWHYYLLTLDVGGAKYAATGRGFIIEHQPFLKLFQQFGRSHFVLGFDLLNLLLVMCLFDRTGVFGGTTVWCWTFAATCLWAPFLYNFEGLHYEKVRDDFWEFWAFMQGGWFGRSVAWQTWHLEKTKLYAGVNLVLALRGSIYILIAGATAFKYFEFFMLEYSIPKIDISIPINLIAGALLILTIVAHCIFQGISALTGDSLRTCDICGTYLWVIASISVVVLFVVTALTLHVYSMPAAFLGCYVIVVVCACRLPAFGVALFVH
eukprot:COSAG05_NODE_819_length_7130_cov_2.161855_2_plen_481_part_00